MAFRFVSVTQQFNTTTSMGRLTLNVLLSFAQFEREVTSERIRDKVAASKKKGIWVGGPLPLGYVMENGKVAVVPEEAEHLLRNRFYIGEVNYKGQLYPGEQFPILDRELFDRVQTMLSDQRSHRDPNSDLLQPSPDRSDV